MLLTKADQRQVCAGRTNTSNHHQLGYIGLAPGLSFTAPAYP